MAGVTQAQIDELRKIVLSGEESAAYDGRSVRYRSLDELKQLLSEMEAELAGATLTAPESMARRRTQGISDRDLWPAGGGDPFTWRP